MIDTILYARDGTNDNLTPEMTLQLLPSMTLLSNYYRPNKNVLAVHYNSYATVYHRLMVTSLFSKELEARWVKMTRVKDPYSRQILRMICRRILCGKLTREEREGFKKRFQELNDEGVVSGSVLVGPKLLTSYRLDRVFFITSITISQSSDFALLKIYRTWLYDWSTKTDFNF